MAQRKVSFIFPHAKAEEKEKPSLSDGQHQTIARKWLGAIARNTPTLPIQGRSIRCETSLAAQTAHSSGTQPSPPYTQAPYQGVCGWVPTKQCKQQTQKRPLNSAVEPHNNTQK